MTSPLVESLMDELEQFLIRHMPAPVSLLSSIERLRDHAELASHVQADGHFALEVDASLRSSDDLTLKKGMLVLLAYRVAHHWIAEGHAAWAFTLQALWANYVSVDIDPRCNIAPGVYFDHPTGIVIGETARIGPRVLLYHGVTLGSLGPMSGGSRRHPALQGDNVIGCGASVLGPITIGRGARVRAGEIVTDDRSASGSKLTKQVDHA